MKKLSFVLALLLCLLSIHPVSIYSQLSGNDDYKNFYPDFQAATRCFYYLPGDTVKIDVKLQWVKKDASFDVKVYRIKDPELFFLYQQQSPAVGFNVVGKDSSNLFSLLEEKETFSQRLRYIKSKNKNEDETYFNFDSSLTYIPKDYGAYIARVYFKNKVCNCGFFVSRIGLFTKTFESSVLNYTADRITSEPIDSVNVNMYMLGGKYANGYTSGGIYNFELTDFLLKNLKKSNYIRPFIIAVKNNEIAVSDPNTYFYFMTKMYTGIIVTSQPVYRPPAVVNFKSTIRKLTTKGYAVYSKGYIRAIVIDARGTRIYKKSLLTDENGSISDSLNIGEEASLGNYYITVEIIDTADSENRENFTFESFSQGFAVEEYKKPEYKVDVKTDKEQYSGKENIKIAVQSDYYFGSPVQDGEVEYKVLKSQLHRPWWYFSPYRWWYEDFYASESSYYSNYYSNSLLFEGKGKLDKDGHLDVTYVLNEDFKIPYTDYDGTTKYYESDFTYTVYVYVKDKSRHNVYSTKTVNVTRAEYFLTSNADKYLYKPGEKIGLVVRASDYSDNPKEANLNVAVNRITYEGKYPKMKKVTSFMGSYSGKTSAGGEETIFIDAPLEGYYEMEVTSFDSKGKKVSDVTGSKVTSGNMWWWLRDPGTVEIVPERESYKPGDTCVALVMLPYDNVNILVTNYNRNVVSYWVERVDGNSVYIKIPVTENNCPNFMIGISFVYDGRVYENSKSIAVIPESKFLNVELASDKPEYRPRDTGYVNIAVKDNLGRPVKNAEVTLGLIDESIYAIKPENTKDIKSVFYAPFQPVSTSSYSYNRSIAYSIKSTFPSYFESYDYKNYKQEELSILSGRLVTTRNYPIAYAHVIIDKQYDASETFSNGLFKFYVPGGKHTINFSTFSYLLDGDIEYNSVPGNIDSMLIISSGSAIESAAINGVNAEISMKDKISSRIFGSIQGTVIVKKDNFPLTGARISVEGTSLMAGTDEQGRYIISNVPVGTYSVKCSYVGYGSQVQAGVGVNSGQVTALDFFLEPGGLMMDTMMIEVKRKELPTETSNGKIISSENFHDIKGIEDISAKVYDVNGNLMTFRGGRDEEKKIIMDGVVINNPLEEPKEEFVEAVTRTDFRDKVIWVPSVRTDEEGNARVPVVYPDNLTTWRFTARVITDKTEVGQVTHPVITRKDLIVRVIAPRFFQQKDEVTVSTIIHNYLSEDKQTKVSLKLDNLQLVSPASNEQVIDLLKNEERRIDWVVKVDKPLGMAKVFASALTNEESDAMEQKLVIHPYGLKTANFFTYKINTGSDTRTFEIPDGVDTRSTSLKLRISPSLASSIIGSLDNLIGYPYGCIEQTISRFIPTVIVSNVMKETGAPEDVYLSAQIPLIVKKGFSKISSMQNADGGFGWWKNDKSDPFMSAYVLYGLKLASNNGYEPDEKVYSRAMKRVKKFATEKGVDVSAKAFLVYVLAFTDSTQVDFISKRITKLESKKLNDLSKSMLSMASGMIGKKEKQQELISDILHNANSDDNGTYWGGKEFKYYWHGDNIHTTAFVIKALVANQTSFKENRDIIESSVSWLLAQRKGDSWGNTQQTAFVVYALTDYMKISNELETDYLLKVFVNNQSVFEKQVTKEDLYKPEIKIDIIGTIIKNGQNEVRIEKYGVGNAYVSNELVYYSDQKKKQIGETDDGFEIEREYFELTKAYDSKEKKLYYKKRPFDGTVKSGEQIFVRVKVTPAKSNMSYFMLEEPIPAGCEIIMEEWAYPIKEEPNYDGNSYDYWRWWFSDKEVRDNRIVYFASYLGSQAYEFTYLLMAEIPGTYNVMPSQGALMYYPDINGSSGNLKLKIVD